jgi:hypothetical protein
MLKFDSFRLEKCTSSKFKSRRWPSQSLSGKSLTKLQTRSLAMALGTAAAGALEPQATLGPKYDRSHWNRPK